MIEANTTHLWQMPNGVDVKVLCASVPASFSKNQFEFGPAWANKNERKQADTARLRLTLRRPVVSHSRHKSADLSLNQQLSLSCIRSASSRPDFWSADSFNHIHADMGSSIPLSAFFVFEKHIPAADFSTN